MSEPVIVRMTSKEVMPLFPTLLWKSQLAPETYEPINRRIIAKLHELTAGEPALKPGGMWQTDQHFNRLEGMSDIDRIMRGTTRAALESLKVKYDNFEITGCWANISAPGAPHKIHTHPNNYLSGVYYVKTQPKANGIVFHDPRPQVSVISPPPAELGPTNAGMLRVQVDTGSLILFPSWLEHSVDANLSSENRISIAFNIMFTEFTEKMSRPRWDGNISLGGSAS